MYKSQFEATFAELVGDRAAYEVTKLKYVEPAKNRTYTPDWTINDFTFIEQKGYWDADSRNKMKLVKEQHPDKVFYMIFQQPNKKIHKSSNTTYGEWATKHGFIWCSLQDKDTWTAWLKGRYGQDTDHTRHASKAGSKRKSSNVARKVHL